MEPLERRLLLAGGVPTPDHVLIVIEENHDYSGLEGIVGYAGAPYINSLVNGSDAAVFTQSFALAHPSQPNYLDLFSGDNQGITTDNVPLNLPFATPNFGAALIAKGLTFAGYAEDLPSVGFTGATSGAYASKHCPWVDWQGTQPNGIPAVDNQPFSAFPADYSTLPTVSFVIPDIYDDMHTTPPAGGSRRTAGDTWLQNNLDGYIQWAKTHNSLFILTFDEDASDQTGVNTQHILTMFVGSMVQIGQYSEYINHYSVLRTIDDMYGLPYAGNSTALAAAPITDVWNDSTPLDVIQGTPGNDVIRIACETANPDTLDVTFNPGPTPTYSVPLANLAQWQISGGAGDDELIIDFSNGNPLPSGGLVYDGGTGANSLTVQGLSGTTSLTQTATQVLLSGFPTIDYNNAGMVLSGANSNTGGTMVLGGSLIMAVDGAIPDGTSLTVGAGGTFIFDPSFSVASSDTSATTAVSTPTNMASSCPLLLMPTEANVSTSGSVAVPSSVFVPGLAGDWPVQSSAPLATLPVGLLLPASSSAPQRNGGAKSVPFGLGRTPAFNKFVASSVAKRIVGDLAWLGQTANNSDNSDQRHKKDSTILALEAAFAQYGQ